MIERALAWLGLQRRAIPEPQSREFQKAVRSHVTAAYDAAQTTPNNAKHWRWADSLNADRANDLAVRKTLRERSRYECLEANSYAKGIVHTLAMDVIGKGPQLHVTTDNEAANSTIQAAFRTWSRRTGLARKLQTMRIAKCVDGEAFAELITNRRLNHAVQLDLRITEADQYSTPTPTLDPTKMVDGIEFDDFGVPEFYHRLRYHPGGFGYSTEIDRVPAAEVIHLFRQDRPGQHRGIPEVTTALPLFQMLRRYTLATVNAAETAARYTAILKTTQTAVADEHGNPTGPSREVQGWDQIDIEYNTMTALPEGWDFTQFDPKQPVTTFDEFVRSLLREVARCIHMTAVIALGDASGTSYSGGRLDVQTYQKAIEIERSYWEDEALDRILAAWFDEAVLAGLIPDGIGAFDELPHQWVWDNREHVDPSKVANAQDTKLRNGLTHRAREYALQGLDVDEEDAKAARSLDMSVDEYRASIAKTLFAAHQPAKPAADLSDETPQADPARTGKEFANAG